MELAVALVDVNIHPCYASEFVQEPELPKVLTTQSSCRPYIMFQPETPKRRSPQPTYLPYLTLQPGRQLSSDARRRGSRPGASLACLRTADPQPLLRRAAAPQKPTVSLYSILL